jgi:hypothetical protein
METAAAAWVERRGVAAVKTIEKLKTYQRFPTGKNGEEDGA